MNGKDANVGGKYTSFRSEKSNKTGSKNGTISQTWHIGKAKAYVGASYDRTIDRGAHPNMLSVFSLVRKGRKKNSFTFSYQSTDKRVRQAAVYDAVHTGLVALTLVCVTFPKELDMPYLKKGIMSVCKSTSAITRRCSRRSRLQTGYRSKGRGEGMSQGARKRTRG
jgi:hypothetical protein